jgi:hypothetical protein
MAVLSLGFWTDLLVFRPILCQETPQAPCFLNWKVSLCISAAWIGLCIVGWMGISLKSWWHDFSWNWERDHAPVQQSTPPPQTNNNYVPPYQVSPYTNSAPSTSPFGAVGPPPTEPRKAIRQLFVSEPVTSSTRGSSPTLNIPTTPHVMPTNTPLTPSNDVGNSFSRTLEELNKKSGQ